MKIEIEYEASWRNSFLDGSNNEPLPKNGRKYIASSTNLAKSENYVKRDVTLSTVMGILNRLIGDQRKLYQAKNDENYYFKNIEKFTTFFDIPKAENSEIVYLRNMLGNTDQNSFTGMINTDDELLTSDYSKELWNVLALDFNELVNFIVNATTVEKEMLLDPIAISDRFAEIGKFKAVDPSNEVLQALAVLDTKFEGTNYKNNKELIVPLNLYCSALYLQIERLSKSYDLSSALTKSGSIAGISKRLFTKKDFMNRFTTGEKKKIFGNPYIAKSFVQGEGQVTSKLTKVNGHLEIILDIDREKARELEQLIENAGVSSFYLGKKGLAYVAHIDTREES
ncbi:type I-Fv CRISPR-associated protein Cas5fv [Sulfuricurvum sp.]|uniref:type I-Fv CRISPR-associated protein Cas5fv n=1 Tax=Sulfuricurvum sp. TaxID=2025608 RepID=UPI0026092887|nr:type I-Fv CRISPR-associated protein Cas5fv [Sulfuricurvum sp.]MDD3596512.1 type I-Fv CRISPR-associated protein Cas5fv [Sulfuricurvum sp.]